MPIARVNLSALATYLCEGDTAPGCGHRWHTKCESLAEAFGPEGLAWVSERDDGPTLDALDLGQSVRAAPPGSFRVLPFAVALAALKNHFARD